MLKTSLTVACSMFAASSAFGISIPLDNSGFESNSSGQFGSIDEWGPNGGWAQHSGFANPGYTAALEANFGFYSAGTGEYVLQNTNTSIVAGDVYGFNAVVTGGGSNEGTVPYVLAYVTNPALLTDGIDVGDFVVFASDTQLVGDAWEAGTGVEDIAPLAADGATLLVGFGSAAEGGLSDIWFDNATAYTNAGPVPEPATAGLFAAGALFLAGRRRRRHA